MPHVVVIGGGISGLTAAFRLSREPTVSVTLLEAATYVGGKIATASLGDARVELGADSFLPRDDLPLRLCREIGLADELVSPTGFGGMVWRKGKLTPLPEGTVLGFPTSVAAIARARVLSPLGKARAAVETLHRHRLTGPDVSVGDFTRARFGSQLLERVVDPLLSGTRAGDVEHMSLAAAIPPVDAAARSHGSVVRGLTRQRTVRGGVRFYAPGRGMQVLVDGLARHIEGDIRYGTPAQQIAPSSKGIAVEVEGDTIECDGVVVATPARIAARLVARWQPQAAWHLEQIPYASSAVVNFLFPRGTVAIPDTGSGVLIPSSEAMTLSGCTWFSSKWPALAAPDGSITIRCFVGRGERDGALDLDDRDLSGVLLNELAAIVRVSADPSATLVTRWDAGLPAYRVGHLERVARIDQLLTAHPRVVLAGADYRGTGIPDCIAQAERAVSSLLSHLQR